MRADIPKSYIADITADAEYQAYLEAFHRLGNNGNIGMVNLAQPNPNAPNNNQPRVDVVGGEIPHPPYVFEVVPINDDQSSDVDPDSTSADPADSPEVADNPDTDPMEH